MCLSSCAEKAIAWLHEAQRPGGGISGAHDGNVWMAPYPEVTGYLIPTLLAWEQYDLARTCGVWLASMQNPNGSFNSWAGGPTVFDTAMILQGLDALGMEKEAKRARAWVATQRIHAAPADASERDYIVQAVSIWNAKPGFPWLDRYAGSLWPFADPQRIHYIAYALEGLKRMGYDISAFLMRLHEMQKPFAWSYRADGSPAELGACVVGNCQMAILLDDKELLEKCATWQMEGGGMPCKPHTPTAIAWAVKYFLDAIKAVSI